MTERIPVELVEDDSQCRITRREIAARVGHEVSFGTLLGELHRHRLPLPRVPSDPASPGVRLIQQLSARPAPHGWNG